MSSFAHGKGLWPVVKKYFDHHMTIIMSDTYTINVHWEHNWAL